MSLRRTGLGDRIICLCAAWIFARNTGRALVVDWRQATYSRSGANLFPACFSNRDEIAGVRLVDPLALDAARLPGPFHPVVWNEQSIARPWREDGDGPEEERLGAVDLIRSGADVPAATAVFRACINDGVVSFDDARRFLAGLRPVARIASSVDDFLKSIPSPAPWIGLHVRHGNGGNILGHAKSWQSFSEAMDRGERAVAEARRRLGSEAPVLLCTDSVDVENAVRKRVPGVIVRPKTYRRSGRGELHAGRAAAEGLDDALVEMLLLSRCHALIRYPAGSFFSFYGAVMKPRSTPPPATIGDLQVPWDPSDPLSPAILF